MELIKKNIHMDHMKCHSKTQITLEEDVNISDNKPDVSSVIYEKATIQIEEVKPTEDHVHIRGRLFFSVLYQSEDAGMQLVLTEGKIPFEEQMYMEGVNGTDAVSVKSTLEDLHVGIINSRKLSVQALLQLSASVEELHDEEAPVDLYFDEEGCVLEYRKCKVELAEIAIQKNDILRLREEICLPKNYPNIFHVLWDCITLEGLEFKPMQESILVQGEIHAFILYEGEGEETPIRTYETHIPFSQNLECHGAKENMLSDITYEVGHKELEIRPDLDGEERMLSLDMVLDICVKLYEEESIDMISDVYGVTKDVECVESEAHMKQIFMRIQGKSKVSERTTAGNGGSRILQILHSSAELFVEKKEIVENGISIEGTIGLKVLTVTGDDKAPYYCIKEIFPFQYTLEVPGILPTDGYKLQSSIDQIQTAMLDSEEMDVKAVLNFRAIIFRDKEVTLISDIKVKELDAEKVGELPGMVVYVVGKDDNLWNIGKRYYISVEKIKEINDLHSDEVGVGDKLLLAKAP